MLRARAEFLEAGHLDPVADAVADAAAAGATGGPIAEIGSGTGHYLRRAHERAGGADCAIGLDLSKHAADIAARANGGLLFVVADAVAGIPLVGGSVDALLSVFAPRPAAECARVLAPGGLLVACFANPGHLAAQRRDWGLISIRPDKLGALEDRLADDFELSSSADLEYSAQLPPRDVRRLIAMGPSARHGARAPAAEGLVGVEFSVTVAAFRRR
ncbi:MAG TPA: methyltransferase domain-containing protein [Solirubrobacterales bacterium]|jgi:SAM-dependent methyltransferase|nr:methyltransferase domain-containing protein [Solirubrobacterales bacterium]